MLAKELKKKFIEFFQSKNHSKIPNASLVPENDPTVLFTTAGMHPLVPCLLGQKHPLGRRLVNNQKCLRTDDIEEVGDDFHMTFFEMLGNWSLGDYWKKEAIEWSWEFLTETLSMEPERIHVTVFAGDEDAPRDEESVKIWKSLGVPEDRIYYMPKEDNWWGPPGKTGPCGPDTEMFYDTGKPECCDECRPGCDCGKYPEIWNDVFMQYRKKKDGTYEPLKQKNVDTGMGVERTAAVLQRKDNVYDTELFVPILDEIRELASDRNEKSERIIADHMRAAVFILAERIEPSNVERGYVLRRLIRRSVRHARQIGIVENFTAEIAKVVIDIYKDEYENLEKRKGFILEQFEKEEKRFRETLEKGMRVLEKEIEELEQSDKKTLSGENAFLLYQSYGFPIEITKEILEEKGMKADESGFQKEYDKHRKKSRTTAEGRFRSGLADESEKTTRLHTATHLLNEALRRVVDEKIKQRGSNITPKRLRFDFNFSRKLTDEEVKKVEDLVNQKIDEGLEVTTKEMDFDDALKSGAQAEFGAKYPDRVTVYSVGDFSKELCTGPHVKNTKEIGKFRIVKQESVGANVKRIRAVVE